MDPRSDLYVAKVRIAALHREAAEHHLASLSRLAVANGPALRSTIRGAAAAAATAVVAMAATARQGRA
jgi:hypothetical protein